MRRLMLFFCSVAGLFSLSACTSVPTGIEPVKGFELPRYLGRWYEVARFDHSFERGLSSVTATYSVRDDGGIEVVNRGFNGKTGQWQQAKGKAYFVDDNRTAHLKVSFFGPFYASYVVFWLDKDDYQHALVTGPDRDYFWLLSRTPNISESKQVKLLQIAKSRGFDLQKLIFVEHNQ